MKLSVIIVNYNVEHFLEQCLLSVRKATKGLDIEVIVVDNNSVDGSVKMLKEKFSEIELIQNKENTGFSVANNQAIKISKGEYVLLLNPDTVVEDDTFKKVISFMDEHPDAGGLGVKMIDGKGKFLPESKRGLPTPSSAFFKIFGLSAIFPKSKLFGKYHLSYLDNDEIHEVDILSGAFMLLRKEALDKAGLLDESFFMYGEDIDLSYRLIKAGYKNYYYPEARIIHYKGESTKKGSANYVFMFYNAMIVFAKKHYSNKNAKLFSIFINLAIYFRAFIALLARFVSKTFKPLIDVIVLFGGIYFIKGYWEANVKFTWGGEYPPEFLTIVLPTYILIWLISIFLSSGYDKPLRILKLLQGIVIGSVIILVIYSLLPESLRFSRAIILLGTLWAMISLSVWRIILSFFNVKAFRIGANKNKRFIIVGDKTESERVSSILRKAYVNTGFIGFVNPEESENIDYIGNINQLSEIVEIHKIDEVIFCSKNIPAQIIINKMSDLQKLEVSIKTAPEEGSFLIGSNSINTSGELYIIDINSIVKRINKRSKRTLDIISSLVFIPFLPILVFIVKKPFRFISNIFLVLFGIKSWVSYNPNDNKTEKLPIIRRGILSPTDAFKNREFNCETTSKINILYARDYKLSNDLNILLKGIRELGRK
ncbi:glycosyltransferase [Bacteroidota bacterium]